MPHPRRQELRDKDLCGLKYFQVLGPWLDRLHANATPRDRAGNRQLHFDQYAGLLLLALFSPLVDSLRGIQQASSLAKVQKLLGCERAALGSLSEASRVFDPALLREIIAELASQALPQIQGREAEALRGLTAVDGALLTALPKMAWALWVDDEHRAVKMHLHFDVLKGVPVEATVTEGNGSETAQLRAALQAGRLYVIDRGYAEYQLFQDIIDRGSSFIGRIRDNAVWTVVEERPVSPAAQAAGVRSDRVVRLGGDKSGAVFSKRCGFWRSIPGKPTARDGRKCCFWLPTVWTWKRNTWPWAIASAGRSNCFSAGSSAFSVVAICYRRAPTGSRSSCTWASSPACSSACGRARSRRNGPWKCSRAANGASATSSRFCTSSSPVRPGTLPTCAGRPGSRPQGPELELLLAGPVGRSFPPEAPGMSCVLLPRGPGDPEGLRPRRENPAGGGLLPRSMTHPRTTSHS